MIEYTIRGYTLSNELVGKTDCEGAEQAAEAMLIWQDRLDSGEVARIELSSFVEPRGIDYITRDEP